MLPHRQWIKHGRASLTRQDVVPPSALCDQAGAGSGHGTGAGNAVVMERSALDTSKNIAFGHDAASK